MTFMVLVKSADLVLHVTVNIIQAFIFRMIISLLK